MLHLRELSGLVAQTKTLSISEHLPHFLSGPCQVEATYQVENTDDLYLIKLFVRGELTVHCQRCLQEFSVSYENATTLVACATEEKAERLQSEYECIVAPKGVVELEDLVRDDLHLYTPSSHPDFKDCDQEVLKNLT